MREYLLGEGFRVITALGGEEGIRLARKTRPDAITLDVLMPNMDGWSVLTALKADSELADIPVIMLTIVEDQNIGYMLGAVEHITKPIDRDRLVAILKKYQNKQSPSHVLVVEDHSETREMLRRRLEREGWAVTEAENGRTALAQVEHNRPALILLDLMMPEMDGFATIETLKSNVKMRTIPIIIVSAQELTQEEHEQLTGRVEALLQKGLFTENELLEDVGRALEKIGSREEKLTV